MVHIVRRSHQDGGIGGDGGRIRPSLQTPDLKTGGAHQLPRSEAGQLEDAIIDESRKKVCAPRAWSNFTMDGMIADILSKREQ